MDDGHPGISPSEESVSEEETTEIPAGRYEPETFLSKWSPPRMASSALLADGVYVISINIILDYAQICLKSWDRISAMIKSQVIAAIISIVSCAWGGVTTSGCAKGVGESGGYYVGRDFYY